MPIRHRTPPSANGLPFWPAHKRGGQQLGAASRRSPPAPALCRARQPAAPRSHPLTWHGHPSEDDGDGRRRGHRLWQRPAVNQAVPPAHVYHPHRKVPQLQVLKPRRQQRLELLHHRRQRQHAAVPGLEARPQPLHRRQLAKLLGNLAERAGRGGKASRTERRHSIPQETRWLSPHAHTCREE